MCPRNRDCSLKVREAALAESDCECGYSAAAPPPSAASTSDLPPLSCPAPTISTPRSRRQRAQKLSRKDQRALVPKLPISISPCSTRKAQESSASDFHSRLFSSTPKPSPPEFYTRPNLLPTTLASSNSSHLLPPPPTPSSARARACLSPRACKASRTTPAVNKIKDTLQHLSQRARAEGTGSHQRPAKRAVREPKRFG